MRPVKTTPTRRYEERSLTFSSGTVATALRGEPPQRVCSEQALRGMMRVPARVKGDYFL